MSLLVGLVTYDRYHGELPGQSADPRARPASIAPIRTETKELKTQAIGVDVTFKCYGADVTATYLTPAVCNGSTVTATPTAAPTVAPKITNTGTYQSAASEKGGLHCSWRGCKWW